MSDASYPTLPIVVEPDVGIVMPDGCRLSARIWMPEQATLGMMGISWGGFNSLQVAAMQPPALKAIISVCSTVDRFADDIHYKGGCLLTENIGWAANMLSYSSRPPDPDLVGEQWMSMWMQRLEHLPFLASPWLRHQKRDAYWRHGSVCEDYAAIKAAVLSVGGWHDGYRNTISHLVSNLSSPVKGIVGPWIHKYPHYAAPKPAIGFLQESLRWWDHWLKGRDTGVEQDPAYRVWLMDSIAPKRWLPERPGKWIGEEWPSKNIESTRFYIDSQSKSAKLTQIAGSCDLRIASSQICGKNSGEYFPFTFGPELPDNQLEDDAVSCCADTPPLVSSLDIIGAPSVTLTVQSDKPLGLVVARLCDLRPDGSSAHITTGMLNLAHRDSFEQPEKLIANKEYQVSFDLDQIAYSLPAGHRLRLALSTTYWPFIWPSPEAATLRVSEASVNMPIKTGFEHTPVEFAPPETSKPWQAETLRATHSNRDTTIDTQSGASITTIHNDFGEHRDLQHQLISGGEVTERWSIKPDDPLSATGDMHWIQTGGRGDWLWKTDATVQLRCDADFFYATATLLVYNNGELIFERKYSETIKRDWV